MSFYRLILTNDVRISSASDAIYACGYADPDTDDRNSTNVFQLVHFVSGYGYANTDTDTETWNSGLTAHFVPALCVPRTA